MEKMVSKSSEGDAEEMIVVGVAIAAIAGYLFFA